MGTKVQNHLVYHYSPYTTTHQTLRFASSSANFSIYAIDYIQGHTYIYVSIRYNVYVCMFVYV